MDISHTLKNQEGVSLVEVIIALVIFGVGMLAVAGLQTHTTLTNARALRQTEALNLAMDQAERLLTLPLSDNAFDVDPKNNPHKESDKSRLAEIAPYTLSWKVSDNKANLPNSRKVKIDVQWNGKVIANIDFIRTETTF